MTNQHRVTPVRPGRTRPGDGFEREDARMPAMMSRERGAEQWRLLHGTRSRAVRQPSGHPASKHVKCREPRASAPRPRQSSRSVLGADPSPTARVRPAVPCGSHRRAVATGCTPEGRASAPARQAIEQIDAAIRRGRRPGDEILPGGKCAGDEGQGDAAEDPRSSPGDYQGILRTPRQPILGRAQGLSAAAAAEEGRDLEGARRPSGPRWSRARFPRQLDSAGAGTSIDGVAAREEPPPAEVSAAMLESAQDWTPASTKELWDTGTGGEGCRRPGAGRDDRHPHEAQASRIWSPHSAVRHAGPTAPCPTHSHREPAVATSRRHSKKKSPRARSARPVRRARPALRGRADGEGLGRPHGRREGAADHPAALREPHVPARTGRRARRPRPVRQLARGLRLRRHERGELRADLPGARARRLRAAQLRLRAVEPVHVPDLHLRQRGAEAEVPAAHGDAAR